MAYQLRQLLGDLCERPEHGAGSSIEQALDSMDDVIGMLEPVEEAHS